MSRARAAWERHLNAAAAPPPAARAQARRARARPTVPASGPRSAPVDDAPDRQVIPILVVGKPRQTRSDVWKTRACVLRYRAFADELRLRAKGLPFRFIAIVDLPMPGSWSERKKVAMDGAPHQTKPDFDNCLKAIVDALCTQDAHLYDGRLIKRYARTPRLLIERVNDHRLWSD